MDASKGTEPPRTRRSDSVLAAAVARMHFLERRTNLQIAADLGISRFRVARLLDLALDTGIVNITINAPVAVDDAQSSALRERYGLTEALVLPWRPDMTDPGAVRAAVGRLAAKYLRELCVDGMKVGVAWGKTLDAVAAGLDGEPRFPRCDVVQLVGNLPTLEDSLHAGDVLRKFAAVLRGASYALDAPLIVRDAHAAEVLRSEEAVARTLTTIRQVDIAVVGIGCWNPPSSRLMEVLPPAELRKIKKLHPVADVCALLFGSQGETLNGDHAARTIAPTLEELRDIPMTIGVVAGAEKAPAIRAVLKSGILNALITDGATAERLLAP